MISSVLRVMVPFLEQLPQRLAIQRIRRVGASPASGRRRIQTPFHSFPVDANRLRPIPGVQSLSNMPGFFGLRDKDVQETAGLPDFDTGCALDLQPILASEIEMGFSRDESFVHR